MPNSISPSRLSFRIGPILRCHLLWLFGISNLAAGVSVATVPEAPPLPEQTSVSPGALASEQGQQPAAPARRLRFDSLQTLLGLPAALAVAADGLPTPQDLVGAAQRGLDNSLDVEAARARLESFGHTSDAARATLRPRADLRLTSGTGRLDSVDPAMKLPRRETTLTIRQAVLDEPARLEWSRQRKLTSSASLQLDSTVSEALLEVSSAWLAALQAAAQVRLATDYEQVLADLARYMTERAAAGGVSNAERDRVRARVANTRSSLADTRASLTVALRNLGRLTDITPGALALELTADALAVPAEQDQALTQARSNNPQLLTARAELEAASIERQVTRAAMFPKLEFELVHARNTNAGGVANFSSDTRAAIVLTIPIANGGGDLARLAASAARRRELEARTRNAERKLLQEVETAYANLQASAVRYDSVRDELTNNTKVVDAFKAQLIGGSRPLLDVLDAYQRLHQSRLDLLQLVISETQTHLLLNHLMGTLGDALVAKR